MVSDFNAALSSSGDLQAAGTSHYLHTAQCIVHVGARWRCCQLDTVVYLDFDSTGIGSITIIIAIYKFIFSFGVARGVAHDFFGGS